jgi:hypothetical protein
VLLRIISSLSQHELPALAAAAGRRAVVDDSGQRGAGYGGVWAPDAVSAVGSMVASTLAVGAMPVVVTGAASRAVTAPISVRGRCLASYAPRGCNVILLLCSADVSISLVASVDAVGGSLRCGCDRVHGRQASNAD